MGAKPRTRGATLSGMGIAYGVPDSGAAPACGANGAGPASGGMWDGGRRNRDPRGSDAMGLLISVWFGARPRAPAWPPRVVFPKKDGKRVTDQKK